VADDELSAPLGKNAKKEQRRFRLPIRIPHMIAGLLGLFVLACAAWALMVDDPFGGEPIAVVATGFDPPKSGPALPAVVSAQGPRSYDGPDAPASKQAPAPTPAQPAAAPLPAANPNTKTVTIIDGSTGKRQEVPISGSRDIRAPLEQRLLETSRHGAIPRIAPDGARSAELYARAAAPLQGKKDGPRVAIVISGLGVSANVTRQAVEKLPGPVTLGFTPYGTDVEGMVTSARAAGHEVLLQAPMEPFDYPDNDPGPQTLLTTLSLDQNTDRLHWLMSRFQGYVGIANYMGARFTSTEAALAPVLKEVSRRGLIYVDDGSSPRSLAGQIAGANNLPFARAEILLDAVTTTAHIDRALARLEALAREHGSAVGMASALPASIERIAQWAKAAEGRGIVLVPITAVAIKPKSS
jgi:polysaccharide deacetylase 2 family uncharacterized protein YibQ